MSVVAGDGDAARGRLSNLSKIVQRPRAGRDPDRHHLYLYAESIHVTRKEGTILQRSGALLSTESNCSLPSAVDEFDIDSSSIYFYILKLVNIVIKYRNESDFF